MAQNHEEDDYNCPQNKTCKFKGFKLVQKERIGVTYSEDTLEMIRGLFIEPPSEELMHKVLNDSDFMDKFEKFDSLMNQNDQMFQGILAFKILAQMRAMIDNLPEVEFMKMRKFLEIRKVDSKIIEKILRNEEVVDILRKAVLDQDWKVIGADAMNKVDKIIKLERKKERKEKSCTLS